MIDRPSTTRKPQSYGVKLVRGPFLSLPPHADHCEDEATFLEYAARIRESGTPLAADLFSGAGGLSLGLEDAGFRVVLSVDHDKSAIRTHRHHFGGMSVGWDLSDPDVVARVGNLMSTAQIDLLAGGPPCQPFSKAGRSMIRYRVQAGERDPHDERRDLWRSFLEVVQIAMPRAVVMENVPDMALDREMFILRSMVEELEQLGYSVEERVIDTWRYGVPQFRQRLILVALRNGLRFKWPAESEEKVTVWNAIGDMPEVEGGWRPDGGEYGWADYEGPITKFQVEMRRGVSQENSRKLFDHITRPVRDDDREAFESMTHATKYTDLAERHQRYRNDIFDDKYKRLNENDLSRTITAHIAKDGYWYIHPRQNRTLTVREAARLQTFPDHFRFDGPPSAAFRQIGNAVPPRLGHVLGEAIRASLEDNTAAAISTRDTASLLAAWFQSRQRNLAIPWLRAEIRFQFVAAEILLERGSPTAIRSMWPLIKKIGAPKDWDARSTSSIVEILVDMANGIGRNQRAQVLVGLVRHLMNSPYALDGPDLSSDSAPGLSTTVANLALLATATAPDGSRLSQTESEEPVLVTKGVLRVASRFQATAVDRRNKLTDGRLAIARMVGLSPNSRDAQKGLIELANSLCKPEAPLCTECPLVDHCAKDGVEDPLDRLL
ncbi:DNA cytosine methyltransferase [Rhodococcus aetherivorans]|uniref:DNA cytosine methyltransferase n=1 Tax=Rhodococcus aetherivorans TaxID=191292 RepID=UPI000A7B06FB|nr:DNA cytosine methyltransferase [Rhodococcus aetherivorans]